MHPSSPLSTDLLCFSCHIWVPVHNSPLHPQPLLTSALLIHSSHLHLFHISCLPLSTSYFCTPCSLLSPLHTIPSTNLNSHPTTAITFAPSIPPPSINSCHLYTQPHVSTTVTSTPKTIPNTQLSPLHQAPDHLQFSPLNSVAPLPSYPHFFLLLPACHTHSFHFWCCTLPSKAYHPSSL